MEQILDLWGVLWRVALAVFFLHAPGIFFWLAVAGVFIGVRRFRHRTIV